MEGPLDSLKQQQPSSPLKLVVVARSLPSLHLYLIALLHATTFGCTPPCVFHAQRVSLWLPNVLRLQLTRTGDAGKPFGNVFQYGAGHVDPPKALCPGLGKTDLPDSCMTPASKQRRMADASKRMQCIGRHMGHATHGSFAL